MSWLTILQNKIILNPEEFPPVDASVKLVFTNGCFDILHKGHVEYLAQAADMGDILVIGINTDASVKRQGKGDDRPINKLEARATLLASLAFVDFVVSFDGDTPIELIEKIKPNVLVKGGDYNPSQTDKSAKDYIVGREVVLNNAGEVKIIDLVQGYSTTSIINKLQK